MAKKPNTESEEESKQEVIEVDPVSFELPYHAPFYILEISSKEEESEEEEKYSVFNTLEGAVEYIDELDDIEIDNIKLLGFNRAEEQFSVSQISWAKIYQTSRDIRKNGG